jgi:hypothetical protein
MFLFYFHRIGLLAGLSIYLFLLICCLFNDDFSVTQTMLRRMKW